MAPILQPRAHLAVVAGFLGCALMTTTFPASSQAEPAPATQSRKESAQATDWVAPRWYRVYFTLGTREEVEEAAYELAHEHRGRIKWILPNAFDVVVTPRAAFDVGRDSRVFRVVEVPADLDPVVPPDKFFASNSPNPGVYTVTLSESLTQYTRERVLGLADQLSALYGGESRGTFTIGMPGFILHASEAVARAMAKDGRVAWVSEDTIEYLDDPHVQPLPPGWQSAPPTPEAP